MAKESKNTSGINYVANKDLGRFKTRVNSRDTLAQFEDPTYLGFKLFFKGINDSRHGGLLGGADNPNSARYYLRQIGDEVRFRMLDTFVNMLQKINNEYPWYFQSITGLEEAWKIRTEIAKPRFKQQITIECLESLDLRMSALVDLYRKAAFDWTNKREILTDNLRHFEMDVMVYDMRTFRKNLKGEKINNQSPGDVSKQEEVNNTFFGESEFDGTQFIFHLGFVEFNLESGSTPFSSISNATNEPAAQSMIFEYETIEESNLFKILSMLYNSNNEKFWYVKDYVNNIARTLAVQGSTKFDKSLLGGGNGIQVSPNVQENINKFDAESQENLNTPASEIGKIYDTSVRGRINELKEGATRKLENITDDFLGNVQKDISSAVTGAIESQLNSLFLGNVYDFSARSIVEKGDRNFNAGNVIDDFNSKK